MLQFRAEPPIKLDPSLPLKERLRRLNIRHFDELIHDQPKEWLIKHFSQGATDYPVNVSLLFRNIVWQTRERIQKGERPPLKELIRTFWYMYIKPTLSRAGSLTHETDQYAQLVDTIVFMVKDWQLMEYKDIGFRDDKKSNRKIGYNANIVLFSEKTGHQDFLSDIYDQYQVSILALGGQPSVLNVEYFVDDLKKQKIDIRRSFYLFSIVDYDPSGWIIRDAFVDDLRHYGVKNTQVIDLIHPDALTPDEVQLARYRIPDTEGMAAKNRAWLDEVHKRDYQNQKYLEEKTKPGKKTIYGLEAESVSAKRLTAALEEQMVPLLGKTEDVLKIIQLQKLNEAVKRLIIHKVT
jgi:hypothetical protein